MTPKIEDRLFEKTLKRERSERIQLAVALVVIGGVIIFMACVLYVAIHFITKHW